MQNSWLSYSIWRLLITIHRKYHSSNECVSFHGFTTSDTFSSKQVKHADKLIPQCLVLYYDVLLQLALSDSCVNSIGHVLHIGCCQSTHVDTAILQKVDVVFLYQNVYLSSYKYKHVMYYIYIPVDIWNWSSLNSFKFVKCSSYQYSIHDYQYFFTEKINHYSSTCSSCHVSVSGRLKFVANEQDFHTIVNTGTCI